MWAWERSTSRTSLAEWLWPTWPSVHPRHSTRKSCPGRTVTAGGMSGCQRLWPGTAWSRMDLLWSTVNTTSGMAVSSHWAPGAAPGWVGAGGAGADRVRLSGALTARRSTPRTATTRAGVSDSLHQRSEEHTSELQSRQYL